MLDTYYTWWIQVLGLIHINLTNHAGLFSGQMPTCLIRLLQSCIQYLRKTNLSSCYIVRKQQAWKWYKHKQTIRKYNLKWWKMFQQPLLRTSNPEGQTKETDPKDLKPTNEKKKEKVNETRKKKHYHSSANSKGLVPPWPRATWRGDSQGPTQILHSRSKE